MIKNCDRVCAAFEAKLRPHFNLDKLETRMVRLRDCDRLIVGYTNLAPEANASSFMRFVVNETSGRSVIEEPFMRFMDRDLKFDSIVADDEGQALDKLADWFIANRDLIDRSRPTWHAY